MAEEPFATLDRVIRRNPGNADLCVRRAVAWRDADRRDQAMEDLNRALLLQPRHMDALALRAAEYIEIDSFEDCIADCDTALGIDLNFKPALSLRALALLKLEKFEHAAADFDRLLAEPDQSHAFYSRGLPNKDWVTKKVQHSILRCLTPSQAMTLKMLAICCSPIVWHQ
jgi:tetratricopeptide (TPR) repeat protein